MTDLPLTDDQLRQIAAHMTAQNGREQTDDRMGIGEMLDETLETLDIDLKDANGDSIEAYELDEDAYDSIVDRIHDLIRDATITAEWPDSDARHVFEAATVTGPDEPEEPVRAFAGKLRDELEKLRAEHERRGLFQAALAYTGAVASLDVAVLDLDGGADA